MADCQNAVEKPPFFLPSWTAVYLVNIFVVIWVLIVGFAFGGWASLTNFVRQVDSFGLFAKCYQCPPRAVAASTPPPYAAAAPKSHFAPPPPHKTWVQNVYWKVSEFERNNMRYIEYVLSVGFIRWHRRQWLSMEDGLVKPGAHKIHTLHIYDTLKLESWHAYNYLQAPNEFIKGIAL